MMRVLMLSAAILRVIVLNVMLSVIMLSVIMLSVIMLSVIMLSVMSSKKRQANQATVGLAMAITASIKHHVDPMSVNQMSAHRDDNLSLPVAHMSG